ncbi:PAS domain S-box-containing protein [Natronoarchaeum philippinense]|uniref:PAS domain S-box-containing protein n=1 Tax=Natronoarchaeum philippinense TaxID=558529 RepID=A0A285N172_NATPI|nr:PAS domain S-box protein [Natronoarchaeum philippinense]SNZ03078.1 PAS domain S-box-containing protein [Natronoarchaeum philippinense]
MESGGTLQQTLDAVEQVGEPGEPVTASELADRIGCSRRTAYDRLEQLADAGELRTKKIGARGRVYWRRQGTGADNVSEDDQQFRSLVDATEEYAIFGLDAEGRIRTWNPGAERIKGYGTDEIIGEHLSTFYTDEDVADGVPEQNLAAAAADGVVKDEGWRVRRDGTRFWAKIVLTAIYDDEGDVEGFAKVTRDMTERRQYERQLRRQRDDLEAELDDVLERVDDAFYALDENLQFTYANEQAEQLLGCSAEELRGSHIEDVFPEADVGERYRECLSTQEPSNFELFSERRSIWLEANVYPSASGLSVYFRDTTERKRREQDLELYERIVETLDDGVYAVDDDSQFVFANEAFCEMLGTDRESLLGEHATTVYDDEIGPKAADAAERVSAGDQNIATLEFDLHTADGERIPVESRFGPLPYGEGEGRCGVVRDITGRKDRERRLEHQRERLEALNALNTIALDITEAIVDQSTRAEIERVLCEDLAASDSYTFAWSAGVDQATESIDPHVEAGVDGYLEDAPMSISPDDALGQGPAGRAVRTQEMQVVEDVFSDPDFEPWHEVAREYGYRASAAVPITHEGTVYGLFGVYADRLDAFAGEERRMLRQLGEVVGHAIVAIDRKRALMGDELVEVEFRIRDVIEMLDIDAESNGRVHLSQTVPLQDDDYLVYGNAVDEDDEFVEELVESLPHWSEVTFDESGNERFELTLADPPVLTTIASLGGDIDEAVIEDGDYRMSVHLSPGADVRQIIGAVQEAYPEAELVTRRQINRTQIDAEAIGSVLTDELTERQRTALESAFYAGFFEWPREQTGEEVAETLGISSPTFHQHVRAAERKVFEALLSTATPRED